MSIRVAVIGAGAAGLCAGRYIHQYPYRFQLTIFEQTNDIGGTWCYDGDTNIHSSMYRDMKTNLPKESMAFSDFPFPAESDSFVHRSSVLNYLRLYAEKHQLIDNIRFLHTVTSIREVKTEWLIEWKSNANNGQQLFDVVFICNGHYFEPEIPQIDGLDSFNGVVMHSHNYRQPDMFAGKQIVCIGAAASGVDIAIELATTANQVYVSDHRQRPIVGLPSNVRSIGAVQSVSKNSMQFMDQLKIDTANIDTIMFCTGYRYCYPFISRSSGIDLNTDDKHVRPLYQHMLHIDYPTRLFFIGINFTVVPFPYFEAQCQYALALLTGSVEPPSRKEMIDWANDEMTRRLHAGLRAHRDAHLLADNQWSYLAELSRLGQFTNVAKPVNRSLYEHVMRSRQTNVVDYKQRRYRLIDEMTFEEMDS